MARPIPNNPYLYFASSDDCKCEYKAIDKSIYFLYVRVSTNSDFYKEVFEVAKSITPNSKGANTSIPRPKDIARLDNFAGLIAEKTCKTILEIRYGKEVSKVWLLFLFVLEKVIFRLFLPMV